MSLSKALIKLLCVPFLCALILMAVASSATFASTTQQTAAQDDCRPVLQKGDSDKDSDGWVHVLQNKLKDKKYDLGNYGPKKDGVDGMFGDKTEAAVTKFQGDNNLSKDGIVGKNTWNKLGVTCKDGPKSGSNRSQTSKAFRIDSCKEGIACGSATFTFTGKNQLTNISMNVRDIKCDGQSPYIVLKVYYNHTYTIAKKVVGNNGCHGAASALTKDQSTYTLKGYNIDGVRVTACTTHKRDTQTVGYTDTSSDPCVPDNYAGKESLYVKNPNL